MLLLRPSWSLTLADGSSCCVEVAWYLWAIVLLTSWPLQMQLPEHTLKSCFQLLSLAFSSLSRLCTRNRLWFHKAWFNLAFYFLPTCCVWHQCRQGTRAPAVPRASPSTAFLLFPVYISYHCRKIIWVLKYHWNNLRSAGGDTIFFLFFLLCILPHQPTYGSWQM